MTYRNDLDALSARQAALETEVRDRTRELDEARRLVAEITARARLPVLDNIRVAAPCSARWEAMAGDDRVRACGDCQKNVYNLSELTRDEAETLIREKEGNLCVRYFQRADGTIMLKDCAVGVSRRRHRRIAAVGVAASLAGAALGVRAAQRHQQVLGGVQELQSTMGAIDLPISELRVPVAEPTQPAVEPAPPPPEVHVKMGKMMVAPREIRGELSIDPRPVAPHGKRK